MLYIALSIPISIHRYIEFKLYVVNFDYYFETTSKRHTESLMAGVRKVEVFGPNLACGLFLYSFQLRILKVFLKKYFKDPKENEEHVTETTCGLKSLKCLHSRKNLSLSVLR